MYIRIYIIERDNIIILSIVVRHFYTPTHVCCADALYDVSTSFKHIYKHTELFTKKSDIKATDFTVSRDIIIIFLFQFCVCIVC